MADETRVEKPAVQSLVTKPEPPPTTYEDGIRRSADMLDEMASRYHDCAKECRRIDSPEMRRIAAKNDYAGYIVTSAARELRRVHGLTGFSGATAWRIVCEKAADVFKAQESK